MYKGLNRKLEAWAKASAISSAMQINGFIGKDHFKKQIDEWIRVFRRTKLAPGTNGPLIPGDPEREAEGIRSKEGIPLIKPVVDSRFKQLLQIIPPVTIGVLWRQRNSSGYE